MKIFNWVHRRFTHKGGLAQNGKNGLIDADETTYDKQFVHGNNAFPNVLDGWKGGILAIGTFGYDPLKDEIEENDASFYAQQQLSLLENESDSQITSDSEEEDEEEEVNPLVFAAYEHDYEGLLEVKMEKDSVSTKGEFDFESEFDAIMMIKSTKKGRTTLAELFSADSEELQKKPSINKGEMIKQNKSNNKHGFSFAKKLIGDRDARPIRKLHRMMRRMLKRKIHPDLGINKHNPVSSSKAVAKKCETSTESASLLSTQDADADATIYMKLDEQYIFEF